MKTPRTDANIYPVKVGGHALVKASFARKLERELQQSKKLAHDGLTYLHTSRKVTTG